MRGAGLGAHVGDGDCVEAVDRLAAANPGACYVFDEMPGADMAKMRTYRPK